MRPDKNIKIYLFLLLAWIFYMITNGQMRLVLNGGNIVISKNAQLVIANSATNAITRNSGHIISEGENNALKWNMGTNTGTYTIPLGYGSDYLPITFTKSAGVGSGGYFLFSTYGTGWQNSAQLPNGVGNVDFNGTDNSAYTIDRFWGVEAAGYTAKPHLNNFILTYRDAEVTASGNYLVESELGLQRWNPGLQDWADFRPGVTVNTTANTITLNTVNTNNLFRWWTMASSGPQNFLPVELTEFKGTCFNGTKTLNWTTASENNSATFELQSSTDAVNWTSVMTIPAAGNSNRLLDYSATDLISSGDNLYYRLKQTDWNGQYEFSSIIRLSCESAGSVSAVEVYPNPSNGVFSLRNFPYGSGVEVFNARGEVVYSASSFQEGENIDLQGKEKGLYFVSIRDGQNASTIKVMLQ